jgi:hypothetical protein
MFPAFIRSRMLRAKLRPRSPEAMAPPLSGIFVHGALPGMSSSSPQSTPASVILFGLRHSPQPEPARAGPSPWRKARGARAWKPLRAESASYDPGLVALSVSIWKCRQPRPHPRAARPPPARAHRPGRPEATWLPTPTPSWRRRRRRPREADLGFP